MFKIEGKKQKEDFFDQTILPEDRSEFSPEIRFRDSFKNLSELLRVQDTDDTNEGTFIALNNTSAIQFADAATKVAYFSYIASSDLFIQQMEFIWSTPATSGNLAWQIDIGEGGDSEANNVRTTGGTQVTTAADGTANDLNHTVFYSYGASLVGGIEIRALQKGNLWGIKFSRNGAHADDTLTNTVNLYGILIRYR